MCQTCRTRCHHLALFRSSAAFLGSPWPRDPPSTHLSFCSRQSRPQALGYPDVPGLPHPPPSSGPIPLPRGLPGICSRHTGPQALGYPDVPGLPHPPPPSGPIPLLRVLPGLIEGPPLDPPSTPLSACSHHTRPQALGYPDVPGLPHPPPPSGPVPLPRGLPGLNPLGPPSAPLSICSRHSRPQALGYPDVPGLPHPPPPSGPIPLPRSLPRLTVGPDLRRVPSPLDPPSAPLSICSRHTRPQALGYPDVPGLPHPPPPSDPILLLRGLPGLTMSPDLRRVPRPQALGYPDVPGLPHPPPPSSPILLPRGPPGLTPLDPPSAPLSICSHHTRPQALGYPDVPGLPHPPPPSGPVPLLRGLPGLTAATPPSPGRLWGFPTGPPPPAALRGPSPALRAPSRGYLLAWLPPARAWPPSRGPHCAPSHEAPRSLRPPRRKSAHVTSGPRARVPKG
ncbi:unnamed protein product [Nyctereutes procyonoides]|uniref:(raccoon dog) hypothetical protein n=1 Tax=Nyctereutes procyonoides TaxID=34880 RepID=A0A811Z3J9_NYCPR|nr:unnamed protein product [Nyctereutes procyonoides]